MQIFAEKIGNREIADFDVVDFKFEDDYPDFDPILHEMMSLPIIKELYGLHYSLKRDENSCYLLFRESVRPMHEYKKISFSDFLDFHEQIKQNPVNNELNEELIRELDNFLTIIELMKFENVTVYSTFEFYEHYACSGVDIDPDWYW